MQTASNIFNSWIRYMFDVLSELSIWPHRDVIVQNMPKTYKADYLSTFAILDCTELKMERPTSLMFQSQSFSNYKSTNTLKSLVACDLRGAVIFFICPLHRIHVRQGDSQTVWYHPATRTTNGQWLFAKRGWHNG